MPDHWVGGGLAAELPGVCLFAACLVSWPVPYCSFFNPGCWCAAQQLAFGFVLSFCIGQGKPYLELRLANNLAFIVNQLVAKGATARRIMALILPPILQPSLNGGLLQPVRADEVHLGFCAALHSREHTVYQEILLLTKGDIQSARSRSSESTTGMHAGCSGTGLFRHRAA